MDNFQVQNTVNKSKLMQKDARGGFVLQKKIVYVFVKSITLYQKIFSFDHSFWARPDIVRVCLHQPSCSEYARQALDKYGLIKGLRMSIKRIISCGPWTRKVIDPVP